jgi:ubiquinone/menaquinone biosynthesis C-methylase UbiE
VGGALRQFGGVFDGVAEQYDAVRPSYPRALIDAALEAGSLGPGSLVLEIGSGTGKLTELLVARGLRVHAVEPGANLVETARRRLGPTGAVRFEIARFEEAELADGAYDAVFCATAFHWIDPAIGWSKVARVLHDNGLLALFTHIGVHDERSSDMQRELLEILRVHAPSVADGWSLPPSLEAVVAGAADRRANASEAWDWIMSDGRHSLAVPRAAALFGDAAVAVAVAREDETADEVLSYMRTTSMYFMLAEDRRQAFEDDYRRMIERHGGSFPFSRAAVLMTARRAPEASHV